MNKQELQQISIWHQDEEHYMIIDFLLKKNDLTTDEKILLARAYNNLEKYDEALSLLNELQEECQKNSMYLYQKGYALFHKDDTCHIEAAALLGKAYELDPENFDAKILMAQANKLEPMSERVERFWQWFLENEESLLAIAKGDSSFNAEEGIQFINQGTALISPNLYFNIGGGNEFTFCVEGNLYPFYLYPYIIENAPKELKERWHFYSQKEEVKDKNFSFTMYDVDTDIQAVQVYPIYNPDENNFQVEYFVPNSDKCTEEERNHLFYTLLELVIGEGVSYNYISGIQEAEYKNEMIALSELSTYIKKILKENDKEFHTNPAQLYTVYRRNVEEQEEDIDFVPRSDIFSGNTSFIELCSEYYREEDFLYCGINSFGADAAFLAFYLPEGLDGQEVLDLRYELEDQIAESLKKQNLGYVFGSAMSEDIIYIELILFNFRDFLIQNFNDQDDLINNIFPSIYKQNTKVQEILNNCSIFYSSFDYGVPMAQLFPDPNEEFQEEGAIHPELNGALSESAQEMFGNLDPQTMMGAFDVEAVQNLAQEMLGQVDLEELSQNVRETGELDEDMLEKAYQDIIQKLNKKE